MPISQQQYRKMMDAMSEEPCGLNLSRDITYGPKPGTRIITIKLCNPPSLDNRKCGICGRPLYKKEVS